MEEPRADDAVEAFAPEDTDVVAEAEMTEVEAGQPAPTSAPGSRVAWFNATGVLPPGVASAAEAADDDVPDLEEDVPVPSAPPPAVPTSAPRVQGKSGSYSTRSPTRFQSRPERPSQRRRTGEAAPPAGP
eukprot:7477534-Alexandrium_andersonii.AAC.1